MDVMRSKRREQSSLTCSNSYAELNVQDSEESGAISSAPIMQARVTRCTRGERRRKCPGLFATSTILAYAMRVVLQYVHSGYTRNSDAEAG